MLHDRPPNILILLTDQQSHGMLSCAGTDWVRTPNLDRLAAGGARFTRAYCSDPVCIPSRFSLFTGRMPSAIRMRGNGGPGLVPFSPEQDRDCLGHLLRERGYGTWYGGKVHLPVGLTAERLGFATYSRDERERLAVDASAVIRSHSHRRDGAPWAVVASFIGPHDICYQAIRAFATEGVERDPSGLGSVELATLDEALRPPPGVSPADFLESHLPPMPPNAAIQQGEPDLIGRVLGQRPFKAAARARWTDAEWRLHRWAYARLTERVDRQIGLVLDALRESGQEEDTLVLMTSDHGEHAGAHRLEHKTFFYEEAARVPWLMRLPGRIPAGSVIDGPLVATGLDLLATCCDYASARVPDHCLGISHRSVAEGCAHPTVRSGVYGENAVSRMRVERRWKYVRYDAGGAADQLYDLDLDPGETRNHAADPANRGTLDGLRSRLDAEIAAHAAVALPGAWPPDGFIE